MYLARKYQLGTLQYFVRLILETGPPRHFTWSFESREGLTSHLQGKSSILLLNYSKTLAKI